MEIFTGPSRIGQLNGGLKENIFTSGKKPNAKTPGFSSTQKGKKSVRKALGDISNNGTSESSSKGGVKHTQRKALGNLSNFNAKRQNFATPRKKVSFEVHSTKKATPVAKPAAAKIIKPPQPSLESIPEVDFCSRKKEKPLEYEGGVDIKSYSRQWQKKVEVDKRQVVDVFVAPVEEEKELEYSFDYDADKSVCADSCSEVEPDLDVSVDDVEIADQDLGFETDDDEDFSVRS